MMRPPATTPGRGFEGFSGGTWRSLVAHLHGVQGVPSSNLGVPTNFITAVFSTGSNAVVGTSYERFGSSANLNSQRLRASHRCSSANF